MPAELTPYPEHETSAGRRPRPAPAVIAAGLAVFLAFVILLSYTMNMASMEVSLTLALCAVLAFLCFVRLRWALYVLVFACLFSPELEIGGVLSRAAKRPITIRIEDILLLIIVFTWLARAAVQKELGLMLRTPLNRPIFRYAAACALATAVGVAYGWVRPPDQVAAGLFVLKYIQYFVLFFMIVNHIETRRDVRNLFIAVVVTYAAVCIYCLAQVPEGGRLTLPSEYHGEPNTLAGYLLLMIGVCSGLLLFARSGAHKLFWGLLAAVGVVLLAYTLSRSGWAGLVGVIAVLAMFGRRRFIVLSATLLVILTFALTSFDTSWMPRRVEERWRETMGQATGYAGVEPVVLMGFRLDPSASLRYQSYAKALDTWGTRSVRYWVPALTGSGVLGAQTFVDGQYVRVVTETGLLGLFAFIALLVAIWRHVWTSYLRLRKPWYRGLALGYLAGFAGLLVHALAANTFIIVRIMEPFFILTGIVALLPVMERAESSPPTATTTD